MKHIIILGTAHLRTTPGKCSPDGRLREYAYSREIVNRVEATLKSLGYTVFVDYRSAEPNAQMQAGTWRKTQNRELAYRVSVVNGICRRYGPENCIYVSVHVNAAGGDGKWHRARGFSVFVSPDASKYSCRLASLFTSTAKRMNLTGNRSIPSQNYWTSNLYVLRQTCCPAVLTENLFQDNREDVDFLLSDKGRQAIVDLHVKAINDYNK